jgi:DNA-binding response OmpR family regulator
MGNPAKLRILVAEDDARMLELLSQGLREAGHTVMPASDGLAALELALNFSFDVIVLDIGLPGRDGYVIACAVRALKQAPRILMLTARDAEDDIIRGFDQGADDYLIKPFSFPELLARLNALARRSQPSQERARLLLDAARLTVMRGNTPVQLTRTEFFLLQSLTEQTGRPVTRQKLIESVWGDEPVHANTLDVFINALRGKIDAPFHSRLIVTIRGVGYLLQPEDGSANRDYKESAG